MAEREPILFKHRVEYAKTALVLILALACTLALGYVAGVWFWHLIH